MAPALAHATLLELVREAPAEVRARVPRSVVRLAHIDALNEAIAIGNDEAHADRLDILEQLDAAKEWCSRDP
jgi:hypothetical protein